MSASDGSPHRGMHLWMLRDIASDQMPALSTQVMSGFGLGPDLKAPVPYVLARRRGHSTQFVALMEPFSGRPEIRKFELVSGNSASGSTYAIEGPGWKDIVTVGDRITLKHRFSRWRAFSN